MPYHVVAVLSYYLLLGVYTYAIGEQEEIRVFSLEIAQVTSQL